jgi:hypothetical protein
MFARVVNDVLKRSIVPKPLLLGDEQVWDLT